MYELVVAICLVQTGSSCQSLEFTPTGEWFPTIELCAQVAFDRVERLTQRPGWRHIVNSVSCKPIADPVI